jgi:hypothetical protein
MSMEHSHAEHESTPEREAFRALEALPGALGYRETEEMAGMRQDLVRAMVAGKDTRDPALRYRLLAEQASDSAEDGRARLGMLVSIAIMRHDGGRYEDFVRDLEDALIVAEQEGVEDAAIVLNEILGYC